MNVPVLPGVRMMVDGFLVWSENNPMTVTNWWMVRSSS